MSFTEKRSDRGPRCPEQRWSVGRYLPPPTLAELAATHADRLIPYVQELCRPGTRSFNGGCAHQRCLSAASYVLPYRNKDGSTTGRALCDDHADLWWNSNVRDYFAEYPVVCQHCGQRVTTEIVLRNHIRRDHLPRMSRAGVQPALRPICCEGVAA